VARAANIIAIQVFSYLPDNPPESNLRSFSGTWVSSLNYVYDTLRFSYTIAAVNISIGGSRFTDQLACDMEPYLAPVKASIDLLRSVGIATVIGSGNNYWGDGINQPGCISSAVAVGATADNDKIAAYSNQNFMVDLLAPGGSPYSGTEMQTSIPVNAYAEGWGTSLATPHVSGAWAILRQAKPDASVGELLYILQHTGKPVIDNIRDWGKRCGVNGNLPCSGLTYKRIDLDAALQALGQPFQNRFTTSAVTLSWNHVSWANGYEVQADNNSDFLTPEFTGNTFSNSDLDIVTDPLANDLYYWRVRGVNGSTQGSWSPAQMFVVNAP
jgi:subtilisin family serine protease